MSVTVVIVPVVVASWPTILPALAAAAGALGFRKLQEERRVNQDRRTADQTASVPIKNCELVGEELGAGQSMEVEKEGVRVRFSVDDKGHCKVAVTGAGHSKSELHVIGQEMADKVVQMVTYHRLMNEANGQGFELVNEEVDEQGAIRIRLRRS
jgi:hypothetical protein